MGEALYTEKEVEGFLGSLSGWVDSLSDRERRILAATVESNDDVKGHSPPFTVGGFLAGYLGGKAPNKDKDLGPAIKQVTNQANQQAGQSSTMK